MSRPSDSLPENNAKVAECARSQAESGIFVIMHHNDNWSPQVRAFRRLLMRAAMAVLSVVSVVVIAAWIGLIIYVVHAAAASTAPVLMTIAWSAFQAVQWIWSQV